jgi:hypothetical protein
MKKQIPSNYKIEIQDLVNKGHRPFEISKILNLNPVSTQCYIKENFNINFSKTYHIGKPDYFHNIDSYMKAYWLGFIAADGYIVNNPSKVVGIQLSETDISVLESFKSHIESDIPIRTIKARTLKNKEKVYNSKPCVRFHIGSKQMFDDLVSHGITQNKSKTLSNIIENIPYEFRDSFIVGYIDGDGTVLLPNGKIKTGTDKWYPSHSVHVTARGTCELLNGIKNHLNISTNISFSVTHVIHINSKKDIIRYLKCYENLDFFLERKYKRLISRLDHPSFNKFMQDQTISSPLT